MIVFFGSSTCKECLHIKQSILYPARKKYKQIRLKIYDVDSDTGFNTLLSMEEHYKVPQSAAIELFFPDTFLTGAADIEQYAPQLIERYITRTDANEMQKNRVPPDSGNFSERLMEKFRSYSLLSIFIAGIIDGVNPCAIATMIFLISFLATQKRKRSEVLAIGLAFTGAVFITYLAMGIGAFKALTFLQKYGWISTVIRWSAAGVAVVIGLLHFRDAVSYSRTGKVADVTLQLPKSVKLKIHKVISGNLSGRSLVIGAVTTGFLVTLLEAVCTGQVYLPTIILMTRHEGLRFTGWIYLIFYNILFVLPLLIVMLCAFWGLRWDRLAKTTQKNMVAIKISIGVLLCSLAVFIICAG